VTSHLIQPLRVSAVAVLLTVLRPTYDAGRAAAQVAGLPPTL